MHLVKYIALIFPLLTSNFLHAESLYSATSYRPLIGDHRAYEVGDLLTILIYETASSSTSADTGTDSSVDFSADAEVQDRDFNAGVELSNRNSGGGTINRTGRLVASVSVTVTDILENGELTVKGEQSIEFNDENQYIKVEGRVRPEDINTDNTVLSTRVADAKIRYVGEGLLGSRQKPGIVRNFFNWLF